MDDVWTELDDLLARYDADFRVDRGSASYWAGQLRVTLTDPAAEPSRSITFYAVGKTHPEFVAEAVVKDFWKWYQEPGTPEPLPVPDWMKQ